MTSSSPDKREHEADIRVETILPKRVLELPPKQPGASITVAFGIQVTNLKDVPCQFLLFFATPMMYDADGHEIPRSGPAVNGSWNPQTTDFQVLMPWQSAAFSVNGRLGWDQDNFYLSLAEKNGTYWSFGDLCPGTYSIQFTYKNDYAAWEQRYYPDLNKVVYLKPVWENPIYNHRRDDVITFEQLWTGRISTPPVGFQLIAPKKSRSPNIGRS